MDDTPHTSWQLYHQPFIVQDQPDLLSSFQRWKLEDDLKFYATFPQARPGANPYTFQSIGCGDHFGSAGFSFNVGPHSEPEGHYSSQAHSHRKETESSLAPALHFDYGPRSENRRASPSSHASSGQPAQSISPDSSIHHSPDASTCGTNARSSYPAPAYHPTVDVQTTTIIPSQHSSLSPQHRPQPEPPIMDYLPSPSSPAPPSHISMTQQASFDALPEAQSDQWRLSENLDTPWQYEPLPQSPTTRTDNQPFSSQPLHASQSPVYRPGRSQSYSHFHPGRHSIRPAGWPMAEKKPLLACLFCRGRKIACGPPDPGSTDPTCNQCHRRSIKCEYPSESRRGMRRKKPVGAVSTASSKAKPGKRSRSNG